ncbi:MAG: hypothetical protein Q8P81_03595 [Nanoarchaeota archaeon]|nr:hypothetical protein [Nanoarchaeota archaeon]
MKKEYEEYKIGQLVRVPLKYKIGYETLGIIIDIEPIKPIIRLQSNVKNYYIVHWFKHHFIFNKFKHNVNFNPYANGGYHPYDLELYTK